MVFDLDPGEGLGWERMQEAARLTRELLTELGLESFCKTSGGKGLHVVVPLTPQAGWDEVKGFSQAVAQHMASTLPKYFPRRWESRIVRTRSLLTTCATTGVEHGRCVLAACAAGHGGVGSYRLG